MGALSRPMPCYGPTINPRQSRRRRERLALAVLSGQDLGTSKLPWIDWWRDAKKAFKVAAQHPRIAPELWAAWEEYWGETYPTK